MSRIARGAVLFMTGIALAGLAGCAVPRAVGKAAGGLVKGAGKVVSGTTKAITKPLR